MGVLFRKTNCIGCIILNFSTNFAPPSLLSYKIVTPSRYDMLVKRYTVILLSHEVDPGSFVEKREMRYESKLLHSAASYVANLGIFSLAAPSTFLTPDFLAREKFKHQYLKCWGYPRFVFVFCKPSKNHHLEPYRSVFIIPKPMIRAGPFPMSLSQQPEFGEGALSSQPPTDGPTKSTVSLRPSLVRLLEVSDPAWQSTQDGSYSGFVQWPCCSRDLSEDHDAACAYPTPQPSMAAGYTDTEPSSILRPCVSIGSHEISPWEYFPVPQRLPENDTPVYYPTQYRGRNPSQNVKPHCEGHQAWQARCSEKTNLQDAGSSESASVSTHTEKPIMGRIGGFMEFTSHGDIMLALQFQQRHNDLCLAYQQVESEIAVNELEAQLHEERVKVARLEAQLNAVYAGLIAPIDGTAFDGQRVAQQSSKLY
ncbi:hypothetical protein B0J12DRAFT_705668 [Macrophomina phaseolina]|uniref:Uncharacterized protein n=1 Tax=Macrophomina phaseolina TaxID=35725 RepID=A0ABQ8FRI6_9PEZI|nr:hypothetical protein B0J12DRAFT_705668 [Macrophomina phaseolina]